jgi:hypothetical protein
MRICDVEKCGLPAEAEHKLKYADGGKYALELCAKHDAQFNNTVNALLVPTQTKIHTETE